MGIIHSKSGVKYDRSDVSFNDSSSSSGQRYADMESFMKFMRRQMKRVQHGFFNNNANRSSYPIFYPLDDLVKYKRCRIEDMVDIEEGEEVAVIISAVDGALHYFDIMEGVQDDTLNVSFATSDSSNILHDELFCAEFCLFILSVISSNFQQIAVSELRENSLPERMCAEQSM